MPNPIPELHQLRFPNVKWGPSDKPVLVLDGQVYHVMGLNGELCGHSAYGVGIHGDHLPSLCAHLRVARLHLYEIRAANLAPLAHVSGLRELAICWNTKVNFLRFVSEMKELQTLVLEDTPKVNDLSPLAACTSLSALEFSGGIWNKNRARTLEPVAAMPNLRYLSLFNLTVAQGGLAPLERCSALRELAVSNQFATEDYARLAARLPGVKCDMFAPWVRLATPVAGKDVLVVGKRKPMLNSEKDAARIARYEEAFRKLKDRYV